MIETDSGRQTFVCDECGDSLGETFRQNEFHALVAQAKAEQWALRNKEGVWQHYCPSCKDSSPTDRVAAQRKLLGL